MKYVLDTSAILSGKDIPLGESLYIPPKVLDEIKQGGRWYRKLQYMRAAGLDVVSPPGNLIDEVKKELKAEEEIDTEEPTEKEDIIEETEEKTIEKEEDIESYSPEIEEEVTEEKTSEEETESKTPTVGDILNTVKRDKEEKVERIFRIDKSIRNSYRFRIR